MSQSAATTNGRRGAPRRPPKAGPSPNGSAAFRPPEGVWPTVTLYVTPAAESRAVFDFLIAADVDLRAVRSRRARPVATFGRFRFTGLDGARELVDLLRDIDAAWEAAARKDMPELFAPLSPAARERIEATHARWRDDARRVLDSVQAANDRRDASPR